MVNLLISTTALYPESGLRRVLDPKTGIIKTLGRLFRNPGEPTPHVVMSNITAFQRFSGNKADFAATGNVEAYLRYRRAFGQRKDE